MENLTQEQLQRTIDTIHQFKQLIVEKGSKKETVDYLIQETGLPKEECEVAFEFYDKIKLP